MERRLPLLSIVLDGRGYFLLGEEPGEVRREEQGPLAELPEVIAQYPGARYALVLNEKVFTRTSSFPFGQRRRVLEALPFQLEGRVPGELSEFEMHHEILVRNGTSEAHTFLFPKTSLELARGIMTHPSLYTPPRWLTLAPWLFASFLEGKEGNHLFFAPEGLDFFTIQGPRLLAYRFFPYSKEERSDPQVAATMITRILASLKELPWTQSLCLWSAPGQGEAIQPFAQELAGFLPEVQTGEADFLAVEGREKRLALLNLRLLEEGKRPALNLAPPVFLALPPQLKREVRVLAPLLLLLLVGILFNFHAGTRALNARAEARENAIRALFLRNLPGEKPIYPVRQLEEYRNRVLSSEAGGVQGRRIDRLLSLHTSIPPEVHLTLEELTYIRGEWNLKGKVNDFQEVDRLKEKLSALPWVEELEVQRAEQRQDLGKVEVRLRLKERLG